MKYWEEPLEENLSYEKAVKIISEHRPLFITRPEWDGVHFYDKHGRYCILFKDGHIETDMQDKAWDKDKNDWMIVSVTAEVIMILIENDLV